MVVGPEQNLGAFLEGVFERESDDFLDVAYHGFSVNGGSYRDLTRLVDLSVDRVKTILTPDALSGMLQEVDQTPIEPLSRLLMHHVNQFEDYDQYEDKASEFKESGDLLIPLDRALKTALRYGFSSAFISLAEEAGDDIQYGAFSLARNDIISYVGENCSALIDRIKKELALWRDIYLTDDSSLVTIGLKPDRFCNCNCPLSTHCDVQLERGIDHDMLERLKTRQDIPDMIIKDDGEVELPLGVIKQFAQKID